MEGLADLPHFPCRLPHKEAEHLFYAAFVLLHGFGIFGDNLGNGLLYGFYIVFYNKPSFLGDIFGVFAFVEHVAEYGFLSGLGNFSVIQHLHQLGKLSGREFEFAVIAVIVNQSKQAPR